MSGKALELACNLAIDPTNQHILIHLADHHNHETGACFPSIKRLAVRSGRNERTVQRALKELEAAGLISRTEQAGKCTHYELYLAGKGEMRSSAPSETAGTVSPPVVCHPRQDVTPDTMSPHPRQDVTPPLAQCHPNKEPNQEENRGREIPTESHRGDLLDALEKPAQKPTKPKPIPNQPVEIPEWMPLEAWNAFVETRKASKHPLTDQAVRLTIRQLEEFRSRGIDVEAALNQSVMAGYRSVFEPKQRTGGGRRGETIQEEVARRMAARQQRSTTTVEEDAARSLALRRARQSQPQPSR